MSIISLEEQLEYLRMIGVEPDVDTSLAKISEEFSREEYEENP